MQRMGSREMAMQILTFPFEADCYDRPAIKADPQGYWNSEPARTDIYGVSFDVLPEGWTLLGMGISRAAFLAPDGFVYKVPHYALDPYSDKGKIGAWAGVRHTNFNEAMTYLVFGDKIESAHPGYRLARSEYLYDLDVMVMEYVEQDVSKWVGYHDIRVFESYGITDLHGGNVFRNVKDGHVVVIDYAATDERTLIAA